MSQDTEIRDAGAPDDVDYLLIRSGQGGRGRMFHIPAESEGTEPLCDRANRAESLVRKSVDKYPRGWYGWCEQCLERHEKRTDE